MSRSIVENIVMSLNKSFANRHPKLAGYAYAYWLEERVCNEFFQFAKTGRVLVSIDGEETWYKTMEAAAEDLLNSFR